nr:unnamed protein product [Digitaria exilis]
MKYRCRRWRSGSGVTVRSATRPTPTSIRGAPYRPLNSVPRLLPCVRRVVLLIVGIASLAATPLPVSGDETVVVAPEYRRR